MVLNSFYVAVNQTEGRVGLAQLNDTVMMNEDSYD